MAERGEPLGNEYVIGLQNELEAASLEPSELLDGDELVNRLVALTAIQNEIREQVDATVMRARDLDKPVQWRRIGAARGVSHSAVQQQWAERAKASAAAKEVGREP